MGFIHYDFEKIEMQWLNIHPIQLLGGALVNALNIGLVTSSPGQLAGASVAILWIAGMTLGIVLLTSIYAFWGRGNKKTKISENEKKDTDLEEVEYWLQKNRDKDPMDLDQSIKNAPEEK